MPVINLNVQITVPDIAAAIDNFLEIYPLPVDDNGAALYTKRDWFNQVIGENVARDLERGRVRKARKAIVFNPDFTGVIVT